MVNEARSNKIKIEFFIKQKRLSNLKIKPMILAAICIANNIKLRGKIIAYSLTVTQWENLFRVQAVR